MARSSNTDYGWVLPVGLLVVAYFGIIKPLTEKLGLTKSPEDREREKDIDAAIKKDGWNPNFYKSYLTNPANAGKKVCLKTSASLDALAKQISDAWGTFNDDENAIYAALRQLRSHVQLSQLCERYALRYKTDLLTRLKNQWYKWDDGLEPQEFIEVAKIVNALPINVEC